MPRFFLHVRDRGSWQLDPDGAECTDLNAAAAMAIGKARMAVGKIAKDRQSASEALDCSIAIADETGKLVLAVPCYEAAFVPGYDPLRNQ